MVRLLRARRDDLTVTRRRSGKGWSFKTGEGVAITDTVDRNRISALGIPPAWTDVRIAAEPRAHIQALGLDAAGRLQYIYHPEWEGRRTRNKQQRLALLTEALPRLRRRVAQDLKAEAGDRKLALALAISMIDSTGMRVGREKYLETSGTRGAGTLYDRDVTVNGAEVCMTFDAKGGKKALYCLNDARLAGAIERIKTLPGKRLLTYKNDAGRVVPLRTSAINQYLSEAAGVRIAAKDFRTLHASSMAGEALSAMERGSSPSARRRQMAQVASEVSQFLRNTPSISRKSYIAPCLFKLFDQGKLAGVWTAPVKTRAGLKTRESRLSAVLATLS